MFLVWSERCWSARLKVQAVCRLVALALVLICNAGAALAQDASSPQGHPNLTVSAVLMPNGPAIQSGLHWRIYKNQINANGTVDLVQESRAAIASFTLEEGTYVVHVGLGLAGGSKTVQIGGQAVTEKILLNAGGLTIAPTLGSTKLTANKVSMSIFVPEKTNSEAKLVVEDAKPDQLIVLPPGRYHIKSVYLDTVGVGALDASPGEPSPTNSVVTADLSVQANKITDVTLRHRAALITLKLVNKEGGEALANTSFTVLTPGGDIIRELIGAFPSLALAEGDYVAIARHDDKTYQKDFQVQTAYDRDVEIEAKKE